ncbi:hypothetical protein DUI87_00066 [Hirundo rustica rustica]|uniref:Uncharacterized protein n=1 Tax=Hirundo rustica rustica TaxID=333673 RepID=A0A3M0LCN1_HIRRU|nr:hypothetical protein DUI87_00066 [Hirundo rustica rustica]
MAAAASRCFHGNGVSSGLATARSVPKTSPETSPMLSGPRSVTGSGRAPSGGIFGFGYRESHVGKTVDCDWLREQKRLARN